MVIGITGGVGAGKSTVLQMIKACDPRVKVVDTDSLAKEMMNEDHGLKRKLQRLFGSDIFCNGVLNSYLLASRVFCEKEKLDLLNSIVHPSVIKRIKRIVKENKDRIIFVESAILMQTELKDLCDYTWFITASVENRIRRLMSSRGYSSKRIDDMMKSQECLQEYSYDEIITNDNIKDTKEKIKKIMKFYLDKFDKE